MDKKSKKKLENEEIFKEMNLSLKDSASIPVAEKTCMGMSVVRAIAAKLLNPEKKWCVSLVMVHYRCI